MLWNAPADARSLAVIERGALTLCASPNALPFASKTGPVPGFQIELGEKIAQQLGVKLTREWVVSAIAKGGTATSPFVYEDDIVAALANREIEARHTDDGRLVQPAACRQAVAPDSSVRQRF
ncbi:hypothetical protein [Bradyrhizobium murdochi]|uniref:hypothetical protein n=1 Tax=Bradyrhizobium murdochi TaxID=1038859 RepID=UPI00040A6089|nr:hypothetical protein [Bradyrhizobium murdochi]